MNSLPVKIFSIVEGDNFLYEAVTNKIFRMEQTNNFDEEELLARFVRNGSISTRIFDAPKFSVPFDEYRHTLEKNLRQMILEVTRRCNLRCSYCVYSGKFPGRRTHENLDMTRKTLERAINFYATHGTTTNKGSISFYGGEALLCCDEIFHAIDYAERVMPEKKLQFAIATNGLLLDKKIFSWLMKKPNVTLNVTLNGLPHDKYRCTVDGKGTLKTLCDNLDIAKKDYPQVWDNQIGFLCNYADYEELINQRNFYLKVIRKMPLLINRIVLPNFVDLLSTDDKEISAREELVDLYIREGDLFLAAYFRVPIAVIHERPISNADTRSFINSCIPFANRFFVTADGRFQICTETTELDELGDLTDGFNFVTLKKIYDDAEKFFADSDCRRCWAQRLCPACFKDFLTPDGSICSLGSTWCRNFRAVLLCDLKLYCRLAYYHRDLLKRLIDS